MSAAGNWRKTPAAAKLTPFRRAVYELLCLVPAGKITTYKALGELLGMPSGQAIGTAMKCNEFAPTVPCHRVLKGGDRVTIGGFKGSLEGSGDANITNKREMLASEGVSVDDKGHLVTAGAEMKAADFPAAEVAAIVAAWKAAGGGGGKAEADEDEAAAAGASVSGTKRKARGGAGSEAPAADASAAAAGAPASKRRAGAGASGEPAALPTAAAATGGASSSSSSSSSGGGVDEAALRGVLSKPGASGAAVRAACRSGALTGHTSGLAPGLAQANLVILPREHAFEFLAFCTRNPKPCPLLEVTDAGCWEAARTAPGSDIRTDLPRYRVYRHGALAEEVTDIRHLWPDASSASSSSSSSSASSASSSSSSSDARSDWVCFLLGCSFSFEEALLQGGVPVRHLQQEKGGPAPPADAPSPPLATDPRNVPMYRTSVPCDGSGPFAGPLVVSMRPMLPDLVDKAVAITEGFPRVHGKPVYWGPPSAIGIDDIGAPHYGDAVTIHPGEVPVFWACGVTPQAALLHAKVPIAITHAPGHMFVTDKTNAELAGFSELDIGGGKHAAKP